MFERFTERARVAVANAGELMQERQGTCATTLDLLVALGRLDEGLAPIVLDDLGVDVQAVSDRGELTQTEAAESYKFADVPGGGQVPFTPSLAGALDKALREALSLGHNYVGTEHLLLGLVRQEDSSSRAWVETNVEGGVDAVRDAVIRRLTGQASKKAEAEALDEPLEKRYMISVGFDGVLHSYVSGWQGGDVIADPPVPGAIEWLTEMCASYDIAIVTPRALHEGGQEAIVEWLNMNGFAPERGVVEIWPRPRAVIDVDTRAFRFRGGFPTFRQVRYSLRAWRPGGTPNGYADRTRKREQARAEEWQRMQDKLGRMKAERRELYKALIAETLACGGIDGEVAAEWLRQHDGEAFEKQLDAAREARDGLD